MRSVTITSWSAPERHQRALHIRLTNSQNYISHHTPPWTDYTRHHTPALYWLHTHLHLIYTHTKATSTHYFFCEVLHWHWL